MAKKNPAVLWTVDQTGDVIGSAGRQRAQKNIGITDGEGKLIGQSATNSFMTSITLDESNELKAEFGRPTLADLTPTTANRSIGTNSSGGIEVQDLSNVTSSAETNPATGTTYVSSITQTSNGQVNYKTQTITEATDESSSSKKGITALTSDLYASNTRTTGNTTAVTPNGVWDAIDSLDVNNITGFGADQTLSTLTETDGKISATFQSIAIGGSAITLGVSGQAVVTDASKNLTTQDLSNVSSTASSSTGTVFVSSISQTSAGQVSYTTQYIPSIPTSTSDLYNDSGFISSTSAGNHKYLTTNGSGVATWLDKPIQRAYYANGNLAHDYADSIEILEVENSPNRKVSLLSNSVTSEKGYLVPTPIANKVLTTNSTGDISWQNATGGSRIQVQYTQTPLDVSNLLFNTSNFSINADNNDLGFYVPTIPNGLTEPLLGSYNNRPSWIEGSPIVAGDYVTINEIADNKVEIGVNTSLVDGLATSARLSGIHSSLSYQIAGVAQTAEANLWRETVTACDATLDLYDPQQAHPGEDVAYEKYLGPMEWIKLCEIEYLPNAPYYTEIVAHFNVLGKFSSWHNANSAVFIAEVYAGITVQTASSDLWVVNCGGKVVHNTAQTYANDMSIELYQSEENPNLVGVLLHCPHAANNYSRVHVEGSVHVVKGDADNVAIEREVGIDTGLDWPAWNTVEVRSGHGRTLLKSVLLTT